MIKIEKKKHTHNTGIMMSDNNWVKWRM